MNNNFWQNSEVSILWRWEHLTPKHGTGSNPKCNAIQLYVGRVCCWFLPLPERFSSSSQVTNINSHYQIVIYLTFCLLLYFKEQGWRSGENAHLPPVWPRFKSQRRCHMWVEFVVGSLPCSKRFFSGYFGFPLSSKTNTSKFQFNLEHTDTFKQVHTNS